MKIISDISKLFNSQDLLSRGLRAGSILTLGSFAENILRFIRNVILARLLAPEAFGLMATVLASVAVVEVFSEVGLRQSVIQNKKGTDESFLNIIWWISSLRGIALYIIGYFIAPFICDFYEKPELLFLIRVGFLAMLFNGFLCPKVHVLEKEMRFKKWVILMQGSGILGVLVAIFLAFYLQNVWALVLGYVTESFIKCILSYSFFPIKPQWNLNMVFLHDILTFSKRMFGLPILTMLFLQTDVFVIGKVLSLGQLGIYTLSRSLAEMPTTFLSKVSSPIVLSTLSQVQDDKNRMKYALLNLTRCTTVFGLPFIAFLAIFSDSILSTVYGPQYGTAAIPFSILCVYSLILLCSSFIVNMYFAIGRPNIHRTALFVRTILFLIIIYPATTYFGLVGAASLILITTCLSLTIHLIYLKRLFGIRYREYLSNWKEGIMLCLVVIIPGTLFKSLIGSHFITALIFGILLCFVAWGLGIYRVIRVYKKELYASTM
jgi:O-antigen/teichoic acid export membrane protein